MKVGQAQTELPRHVRPHSVICEVRAAGVTEAVEEKGHGKLSKQQVAGLLVVTCVQCLYE